MPHKFTEAIFRAKLPLTEKLVLWVLSERANANGVAWPGQSRIAADAGCDYTTVAHALKRLQDKGVITHTGWLTSPNGPTKEFTVNLNRILALGEEPSVGATPTVGADSTVGGAPEKPINSHIPVGDTPMTQTGTRGAGGSGVSLMILLLSTGHQLQLQILPFRFAQKSRNSNTKSDGLAPEILSRTLPQTFAATKLADRMNPLTRRTPVPLPPSPVLETGHAGLPITCGCICRPGQRLKFLTRGKHGGLWTFRRRLIGAGSLSNWKTSFVLASTVLLANTTSGLSQSARKRVLNVSTRLPWLSESWVRSMISSAQSVRHFSPTSILWWNTTGRHTNLK